MFIALWDIIHVVVKDKLHDDFNQLMGPEISPINCLNDWPTKKGTTAGHRLEIICVELR